MKLFLETKGLEQLTVVGWSTGGGVAMELAVNYPQLVKKLILVESVSYKGYPIWQKEETGKTLEGKAYGSKEDMAKDPIQVAPILMALETHNAPLMKQIWDLAIYVHQKPNEKQYQEYLEATLEQRNLIDIDWSLANFNLSDTIKNIACPVLSFWGDSDLVVSRQMVEETVEAIGDNAHMEVLPKCGHSPLVDCPEFLVKKILNFIE